MTIQKIVEEINQIFAVGETQVIYDLDLAQKEFVEETNYLEQQAVLANLSTNFAWALPSNYHRFKEILLYDSNGNPLYLSDYNLAYEIEFNKLFFKSTSCTPIQTIPTGINNIYLSYYYLPDTLTNITASFSVNDEHISTIYAKVYKKYYSRYPVDIMTRTGEIIKTRDINMIRFWGQEETNGRIKAKRFINAKKYSGNGSAINYGMAGNFALPQRMDSNMIVLQGLNGVYSKYARFLIDAGTVTVTQQGNILGFTSCTAVLDLPNNTVTFTGNFSNITDYESNNKDSRVITANSTTLAIQWGALSGQCDIIVFEKN